MKNLFYNYFWSFWHFFFACDVFSHVLICDEIEKIFSSAFMRWVVLDEVELKVLFHVVAFSHFSLYLDLKCYTFSRENRRHPHKIQGCHTQQNVLIMSFYLEEIWFLWMGLTEISKISEITVKFCSQNFVKTLKVFWIKVFIL